VGLRYAVSENQCKMNAEEVEVSGLINSKGIKRKTP
jgi:hypothetical protein